MNGMSRKIGDSTPQRMVARATRGNRDDDIG